MHVPQRPAEFQALQQPLDSALQVLAASVSLNVQHSPRLKETARLCAGPLSAPHCIGNLCPKVAVALWETVCEV